MPDPLTGMIISGIASAGGSILGADKAAKAQDKATDAQVASNDKNIEFQREIFDQQREDSMPWRLAGLEALDGIKTGIANGSFTMEGWDFKKDPGYEFRRAEGQKSLDRGAAARGMTLSGQQVKNSLNYNQNFATQEYGNAYNRAKSEKIDNYNRLAGVAGVGQQATQEINNNSSRMGVNVGNSIMASGNAIATGATNIGSIYSDMYGNIAGAGNQSIKNYLTYKMVG